MKKTIATKPGKPTKHSAFTVAEETARTSEEIKHVARRKLSNNTKMARKATMRDKIKTKFSLTDQEFDELKEAMR